MWGNLDESVAGNAGGFLDETRSAPTQSDNEAKRGKNIVPVLIKQLTTCKKELKIGDITARTITFLARVANVEQATTKTTYELEDETGSIVAYRWLEAEKNTAASAMEVGTYVRVHGHLRDHNEKNHVLLQKIWPVTNLNELTNHLLEVLYIACSIHAPKSNGGGFVANSSMRMDVETSAAADESTIGLTKEQAIVFKIIQAENDSDNGIERNALKARVPKNILSQVDNIIDFLISEGHIYSTFSDDYFKTT